LSAAILFPLALLVYLVVLFGMIGYARRRGQTPEGEEEEAVDPLRPFALRVLRHATVLCYDYLGVTVAGSLVTFFLGLFLILLVPSPKPGSPPLLSLFRLGALLVPLTALLTGPTHLAVLVAQREDPHPLDLLRGWRRFALRGAGLGLLNAFIFLVLAGDLLFFLFRDQTLLRLLAVFFGYLLLLWALAQTYLFPLLLQGFSPVRALRQSLLLVLGNPVFTGLVSFVIIAGVWLSILTWVPMMLFTPVWAAVASVAATDALTRKYEALEREASPQSTQRDTENP
jgi:hypothetical protein